MTNGNSQKMSNDNGNPFSIKAILQAVLDILRGDFSNTRHTLLKIGTGWIVDKFTKPKIECATSVQKDGLLKISKNCENPERVADVIFVHGLDGNARTTWHPNDKPNDFWPEWLGNDLPQVGIWSLGYAVSSSAWKGTTMPLVDRATT